MPISDVDGIFLDVKPVFFQTSSPFFQTSTPKSQTEPPLSLKILSFAGSTAMVTRLLALLHSLFCGGEGTLLMEEMTFSDVDGEFSDVKPVFSDVISFFSDVNPKKSD